MKTYLCGADGTKNRTASWQLYSPNRVRRIQLIESPELFNCWIRNPGLLAPRLSYTYVRGQTPGHACVHRIFDLWGLCHQAHSIWTTISQARFSIDHDHLTSQELLDSWLEADSLQATLRWKRIGSATAGNVSDAVWSVTSHSPDVNGARSSESSAPDIVIHRRQG